MIQEIGKFSRLHVTGTLILILAALTFPDISELKWILDLQTDLAFRVILVFSIGFFVGYVLELILNIFGEYVVGLITSPIPQKAKNRKKWQDEKIESILKTTPTLWKLFEEKSSQGRFEATAQFLSTSMPLEGGAASPLVHLERCKSSALSCFLFLILSIIGGLSSIGLGISVRIGSLGLFISFALFILCFLYARVEYEKGKEGTIASLREMVDARIAREMEEKRVAEIKARSVEMEAKEVELKISGLVSKLKEVHDNLASSNSMRREIGARALYDQTTANLSIFERLDLQLTQELDSCLQLLSTLRNEEIAFSRLVNALEMMIINTRSLRLYEYLETEYSEVLIQIFSDPSINVTLQRSIFNVFRLMRNSRIVDVIFDIALKLQESEFEKFFYVETLGNSFLSDNNRQKIESKLNSLVDPLSKGKKRKFVVETFDNLRRRESQNIKDRKNIPMAYREI